MVKSWTFRLQSSFHLANNLTLKKLEQKRLKETTSEFPDSEIV